MNEEPDQKPTSILNEEQMALVKAYLNKEVKDTLADAGREERIERNEEIDRQRTIRPRDKERNHPWDGAANTVPPLMWTKISSVVGKFVQAILAKDPIFAYSSSDPDMTDHAQAVTRHIQTIVDDANQAGFRKKVWPLEFDKASFGTVFVKVPFEIKDRVFTRAGKKITQVIRRCPVPRIIPFEDFITRYHWTDIAEMPWYGIRTRLFMHQLRAMEASGEYENVDQVLGVNQQLDDTKAARMENLGVEEQYDNVDANKVFEIFEINMFFDVEGDGISEDIIVHYEPESDTILRIDYNDLGRRDVVRIPYAEIPGVLYGMGLGDMTSSLQDMIETVFNTSFNSDELSYMGLLVTRQGSGIEFGKDVFPGATLDVPNPSEDLKLFQFPSVTPQAMLLEKKIMGYADQATGATAMLVGQENGGEGNRIGSQGTQMLAGNAESYLQSFLEVAINGYQEIGELMLLQMVRNYDYVDLSNMTESDQILLEQVYSTPVENIASKFKFGVSLANIQQDKQKRQAALVQLFQLYDMFINKQVQLVTAMSNPELAQPGFERLQEIFMTGFVGQNKLFERILENFDEKELSDFQAFYGDMELVLQKLDKKKEEMVEQQRTQDNKETAGATEVAGMDTAGSGGSDVLGGPPEEGTQEVSRPPQSGAPVGPNAGNGPTQGV
jgi:hypothetical protein